MFDITNVQALCRFSNLEFVKISQPGKTEFVRNTFLSLTLRQSFKITRETIWQFQSTLVWNEMHKDTFLHTVL